LLDKIDKQLSRICKEAKQLGSVVFADVVSPHGKGWDFVIPAFEWMDIFHCNDLEAKKITGEADLWTAVRQIADVGVKVVLVTRGERGVLAKVPGAEIELPAFSVPVVDPTGAGDAFCAGILFQLTQKPLFTILKNRGEISALASAHWKKMLIYGSVCGAACCKAVGTTTSVKPEYIDTLLKEQGREIRD
jgi:sugar/nucleoside kinase (ribokinase family)